MISKKSYLFYIIGIAILLFVYLYRYKSVVVEGVEDSYYSKVEDLQNILSKSVGSVRDNIKNLIQSATSKTVEKNQENIKRHDELLQRISSKDSAVMEANSKLDELSAVVEEKLKRPPLDEKIAGLSFNDGVPIS